MTRIRRIEDRDRIFFITFNLAMRVSHLTPAERDVVLETLDDIREPLDFLNLGYVVMPDHVHLLLLPRRVSLVRILRDLKSKTGFALARTSGRNGKVWQQSYFDFICRRLRDVSNKLDYIHQNPVKVGLVQKPEDWKWSSYAYYAKIGAPPVTIDLLDFAGDPNELLWPVPGRPL